MHFSYCRPVLTLCLLLTLSTAEDDCSSVSAPDSCSSSSTTHQPNGKCHESSSGCFDQLLCDCLRETAEQCLCGSMVNFNGVDFNGCCNCGCGTCVEMCAGFIPDPDPPPSTAPPTSDRSNKPDDPSSGVSPKNPLPRSAPVDALAHGTPVELSNPHLSPPDMTHWDPYWNITTPFTPSPPSETLFVSALAAGRPFLVRGECSSWPALTTVTNDWLVSTYSHLGAEGIAPEAHRLIGDGVMKQRSEVFADDDWQHVPKAFFNIAKNLADKKRAKDTGFTASHDFEGIYMQLNHPRVDKDWTEMHLTPQYLTYRDLVRAPTFFPPHVRSQIDGPGLLSKLSRVVSGVFSSGPEGLDVDYNGPSVYFGGPSAGFGNAGLKGTPGHSDMGSCNLVWQAQVQGRKDWHLQNLLNNTDNVRFTAEEGDVFFFTPQWWHQTFVGGDEASTALTFYASKPCGFGVKLDYFVEMWSKMLCGKVLDRNGKDMMIYYGACYDPWFGCPGIQNPPPRTAPPGFCDAKT